jgi:hypothetical protein
MLCPRGQDIADHKHETSERTDGCGSAPLHFGIAWIVGIVVIVWRRLLCRITRGIASMMGTMNQRVVTQSDGSR